MSTAPVPHDDTTTFCRALLTGVPEGMHALLWTLQDHRSTWLPADDPDKVAAAAARLSADEMDVYIAVSVAAARPPAGMRPQHTYRIEAANSAGLFGLWADIDIRERDVHQKWNLPPDEKAAFALLDAAGLEPSLVVHSGHGLQAWWLFPEFWTFDSEDDRHAAAGLAQRWNATLRVRAAEKQWTVDSVFDLARVMRVPGTSNRKGDPVVPVRLIRTSDARYQPEDFEAHAVDEKFLADRGLMPTRGYQTDDLDLSETATPPFEKFQAAMLNDEQFARTWNRQRKDFADPSPSSYDMSLASQAAQYGWSDAEIAALLIAFRRQHGLDVQKALRPDYQARTIGKARDARARDEAVEAIEDVAADLVTAKQTGDDEDVRNARRQALDVIGAQLGLQVLHVVRYTSEPPTFRLITPTHAVDLGGADQVLSWSKFRTSVWEATGHLIERFKPLAWDRLTEMIAQVWEEQDVGFETTERGETYGWLVGYLDDRPPVASLAEAAESEYPFVDAQGRTVVFGGSLRRWLHVKFGERVSAKELGRRLRNFGCVPDKVGVPVPGDASKRTTKATWVLPDNWQTGVTRTG